MKNTILSTIGVQINATEKISNEFESGSHSANFLNEYFDDKNAPPDRMVPPDIEQILSQINKSRQRSKRDTYQHSLIQGSLICPEFGLLVQSDATNSHLYCDHLELLAHSSVDATPTPATMHAVITAMNAFDTEEYIDRNGVIIARLGGNKECSHLNFQSLPWSLQLI
jgi:hypothetical protein